MESLPNLNFGQQSFINHWQTTYDESYNSGLWMNELEVIGCMSRYFVSDFMSCLGMTVDGQPVKDGKRGFTTKAMIKRVIYVMTQFQLQYEEQVPSEITSNCNGNVDEKSDEVRVAGISLQDFKDVASAFEKYIEQQFRTCDESNPLSNDLVLSNVLRYLQLPDLLSLRLVNRRINERAATRTRQVCKKELRNTAYFPALMTLMEASDEKTFPITSFKFMIGSLMTYRTSYCAVQDYLKFITRYGGRVEDLDLDIYEHSPFKYLLSNTFQNTPNLKTLYIDFGTPPTGPMKDLFYPDEDLAKFKMEEVHTLIHSNNYAHYQTFLHELLLRMPNVRNLTHYGSLDTSIDTTSIVKLRTLRELCIDYDPLFFLKQFQPQGIQELDITMSVEGESDIAKYVKFFELISNTLEDLKCFIEHASCDLVQQRGCFYLELPLMPKLHTVDIGGGITETTSAVVRVHYRHLPNLRRITLLDLKALDDCFEDSIFCNVSELKVNSWMRATQSRMDKISMLFPNLRRLLVFFCASVHEDLAPIFSCLRGLEKLELRIYPQDGADINAILSGFPVECNPVVDPLLVSNNQGLMTMAPPKASLQDLKHLTHLKIQFNYFHPPKRTNITNIGVMLGLLRIQPLSNLTLRGDFCISEENVKKLREYHKVAVVTYDSWRATYY